jgi:hypothetical protein
MVQGNGIKEAGEPAPLDAVVSVIGGPLGGTKRQRILGQSSWPGRQSFLYRDPKDDGLFHRYVLVGDIWEYGGSKYYNDESCKHRMC